jgi:hypothetical protein
MSLVNAATIGLLVRCAFDVGMEAPFMRFRTSYAPDRSFADVQCAAATTVEMPSVPTVGVQRRSHMRRPLRDSSCEPNRGMAPFSFDERPANGFAERRSRRRQPSDPGRGCLPFSAQ